MLQLASESTVAAAAAVAAALCASVMPITCLCKSSVSVPKVSGALAVDNSSSERERVAAKVRPATTSLWRNTQGRSSGSSPQLGSSSANWLRPHSHLHTYSAMVALARCRCCLCQRRVTLFRLKQQYIMATHARMFGRTSTGCVSLDRTDCCKLMKNGQSCKF